MLITHDHSEWQAGYTTCIKLLTDAGELVGTCYVSACRHLSSFGIDPEYRGQGWGNKMLEYIKSTFGPPLTLVAGPSHNSPFTPVQLCHFYERHGFRLADNGQRRYGAFMEWKGDES